MDRELSLTPEVNKKGQRSGELIVVGRGPTNTSLETRLIAEFMSELQIT